MQKAARGTILLAGALQLVQIQSGSALWNLFGRIGRFGEPSIDPDQYPSDQADHTGKEGEHPSEGHDVQKEGHALSGVGTAIVPVRVARLWSPSIASQVHCPIAELASPIKD
jgi:hypothetical protein